MSEKLFEGLEALGGNVPTLATPFLYGVAKGDVSGKSKLRIMGYNNDVDAAVEDLWTNGGTYVPPTAAMGMEIVSAAAADAGVVIKSGTSDSITCVSSTNDSCIITLTDAAVDFLAATIVAAGDYVLLETDHAKAVVLTVAQHVLTMRSYDGSDPTSAQPYRIVDDSAGGTGVKVVAIHYLDGDYAEAEEYVVLDGTTPVLTAAVDILRVNAIHTIFAGTGNAAAGQIDLRHLADTPIYRSIPIDFNSDSDGFYTVPSGKTLYITTWQIGSGTGSNNRACQAWLRATADDHGYYTIGRWDTKGMALTQDSTIFIPMLAPLKIPALADVKVSAKCQETNSKMSTHFEGWLE